MEMEEEILLIQDIMIIIIKIIIQFLNPFKKNTVKKKKLKYILKKIKILMSFHFFNNKFRIKRNYITMIEEQRKFFPNVEVDGPNIKTKNNYALLF